MVPGADRVMASKRNPPMNPLARVLAEVTGSETDRAWNAESPVTAPGVLVTVAPAACASASGAFRVSVAPETDVMVSVSAGDPMVRVSPSANVSGLRAVPGWTVTAFAPAAAAVARVLAPGVRKYVLDSEKARDTAGAVEPLG